LKFARAIEMEIQNSKACYADAKAESVEFKQEKLNQIYKGNKYNQKSWEKKPGYSKKNTKCGNCNRIHKGSFCPSENKECINCKDKGHFIAFCKKNQNQNDRKDTQLKA
jgi:hypothetical protein